MEANAKHQKMLEKIREFRLIDDTFMNVVFQRQSLYAGVDPLPFGT